MRWFLGILVFLCVPLPALALDNELQHWEMVTLRVDAPHKLRLYAEVQPRGGLNAEGMDRVLIRPAVGYQVTPNVSVWQGYLWMPLFREESGDEHRLFQQVLVENEWQRLKLINRTRLEERMSDNAGGTSVRARHMARLVYALGKSKKWSLVGYNEFFWNLNDTRRGPQAGFDQNRIFAGVNRKLGKAMNAALGYLLNHVNRQSPTDDKLNHVIMLTVNLHLK